MGDKVLLIPYRENALVKADRQISIVSKTLVRIDVELLANLLIRHGVNLFETLSTSYNLPWSMPLIEKYEDRWDWFSLSSNRNLPWSESLIEKYEDRWDWCYFPH
jgi:hypothetical protein